MKKAISKINIKKLINIFIYLSIIALYLYDFKTKLAGDNAYSIQKISLLAVFSIMLSLIMFICLKYFIKRKYEPYKMFFALSIMLGIFYILIAPLFTGSDEHNHYYRIYEISQGEFITPIQSDGTIGSYMPSSIYKTFYNDSSPKTVRNVEIKYKDELETYNIPLRKNEIELYGNGNKGYRNTAIYGPIQYLPEVIGFFIGRIMMFTPFIIGYLGRIFNLLFYVLIGTYFMKRLPKHHLLAMFALLSPTAICAATTLTADGFTNIVLFAFIALLISNLSSKSDITKLDESLFIILSILIASCKIVYLPFIFLLLFLNKNKFKSRKERFLFLFLCFVPAIIISLWWLKTTSIYSTAVYGNSLVQTKHILHNPISYFIVMLRTYSRDLVVLLFNLVGSTDLYYAQMGIYSIIPITYLILLYFSFRSDNSKDDMKLSNLCKTILVILGILILVLITTAIYVQFTSGINIDNNVVLGIQGRYFIYALLLLLFANNKRDMHFENNNELYIIFMFTHLSVLLQMFIRFFI